MDLVGEELNIMERRFHLVLFLLTTCATTIGACIDDSESAMLRKAMSWHQFWFAAETSAFLTPVAESGVRVEGRSEVSYLIWPGGFWIRAASISRDRRSLLDVQKISGDKERELRETIIYVKRLASDVDSQIVSECHFEMPIATPERGSDRSGTAMEPWYREAVLRELRANQQWYNCPCTIWIARYVEGEPKAFALISGGGGESVVAFSVDYDKRQVKEQLGKWISPRDPVYQEFVRRVRRHAVVESLGVLGK